MTVETEVASVTAGDGLRGVSGVQGWYRDAVADFVRHSDAEGRENESVGVFLIEPHAVLDNGPDPFVRQVAWKARYLALENEEIGRGNGKRAFSVSPEQIENVWKEAESRQKLFFKPLSGLQIVGKRYYPLMGLGHSHPAGSVGASVKDLEAFKAWRTMQFELAEADGRTRLIADGHFVYAFGGLVDTLLMLDAAGSITASVRGNFVAAVQ